MGILDMPNTTAAANENLWKAENFDEFLKANQQNMLDMTLRDYLNAQLYYKDLRVSDVVRDSGLTKSYVHQIFNGEKHPSRNKLIAIAFGLHLDADETQRMLKLGGCSELYARTERDALILFCILHGKSIDETDDALDKRGFERLIKN